MADPALFWLIKYLDLAVVIPTALVSAALWQGHYRTAGLGVLAFSTWMTAAIAGMQLAMVLAGGAPAAALVVAGVMAANAAWTGWLTLTA